MDEEWERWVKGEGMGERGWARGGEASRDGKERKGVGGMGMGEGRGGKDEGARMRGVGNRKAGGGGTRPERESPLSTRRHSQLHHLHTPASPVTRVRRTIPSTRVLQTIPST